MSHHPISRRALLGRGLATGTALALAPALAHAAPRPENAHPVGKPKAPKPPATTGLPSSDIEVLNFALLLEYLETDYYTRTLAAQTRKPYLTPRFITLAQSLRDQEAAHVQALTQTITQGGGTPIAAPQFQFPAEAFISPVFWSGFATAMEETGVGAYLGQAGRLRTPALLQAAASIYGVEERHAAILRSYGNGDASPRPIERALNSTQVGNLVARYIVGGLPAGM